MFIKWCKILNKAPVLLYIRFKSSPKLRHIIDKIVVTKFLNCCKITSTIGSEHSIKLQLKYSWKIEAFTIKSKAQTYSVLGHDAKFDVGVRDVGLAVVEPGLSHESFPDRRERAVAPQHEVGLVRRPLGGIATKKNYFEWIWAKIKEYLTEICNAINQPNPIK